MLKSEFKGQMESKFDLVLLRDHTFKTSACSRGGGVKNLPNLPTDSTKKQATVGGWGSKKCENLPTS